ncbi:unnamed protein product, partial [Hapterophycus canaliculatus]
TSAHCVDISIEDNLYMGAWSIFATSYEVSAPVCTWTDEASSTYQIIASNADAIGTFNLVNSTASLLPFSIFWQDDFNASAWNQLQPDVASTEIYLFDTAEQCSGGANTAMKIEVLKLDFDNVAAGIYSGTIVLTLLPQ